MTIKFTFADPAKPKRLVAADTFAEVVAQAPPGARLAYVDADGGLVELTADSWALDNANESVVIASAEFMSTHLLQYGFDTITIDEGWAENNGLLLDAYGRPAPDPVKFPSSAGGLGMKPLAARLAQLGIKLGLWYIRGVPKAAVAGKMPIAGSPYTADQAARLDRPCSWSGLCHGASRAGASRTG